MHRLLFNTKIGYPTGDQLYHKFIVFVEIDEYENTVAQIRFDQSNLDQFYDATEDVISDLDDDQEVQDKVLDFFEQFDVEEYLINKLNEFGIKKGLDQERFNEIVDKESQLEHYN